MTATDKPARARAPRLRPMTLDGAEAVVNAVVGLAISAAVVQAVWPLMGWPVTASQSISVSALFFVLSIARGYVLRRLFRRLGTVRAAPLDPRAAAPAASLPVQEV